MSNPFIDFKAQEISPEKQKCYFVEPDHIDKLISPKAQLIFGERGSGKTTILKHLEKTFNHSEDFAYIGIYYRFETAYVKALNRSKMTEEQNILAFSQSIAAIIGKLLCGVLEDIKKDKHISYETESAICQHIISDIEMHIEEKITTFEQLASILERVRKKILINLQNGKSVCYFDYIAFINDFCEALRKEKLFQDTCFCVLFDEYENLTYLEQRIVNSFIKASSYYLTYKVCMRPEGFLTKDTVAKEEHLIFGHDYEELDYVHDIVGTEKNIRMHLRKICANRLEYFYNQQNIQFDNSALEIDNYLEIIGGEEEIESWSRIEEYKDELKDQLKKKYPSRVIEIDKIKNVVDLKLIYLLCEKAYSEGEIFDNIGGFTKKYKNWLHNYKQNIIFQIISECEQTKKYCGFDTFIKLANRNTRTILEILYYAFGDYDGSDKIYGKISVNRQTKAINRVAESSFEQIDYIPVNGYKAKNLVNALGNLFASFIQEQRASKFETNSFTIIATKNFCEDKDKLKELKDVLHAVVVWGVLIPSKANKVKNMGDIAFDGRDYVLNPIFAPYFKISYRKRQKCELKDIVVYSMLNQKTRRDIKDIKSEINNEYIQQELELIT